MTLVDASRDPDYLRGLSKDLGAFAEDLDWFLGMCRYVDPDVRRGTNLAALTVNDDANAGKAIDAMTDVSLAAGRIMAVPEITGLKTTGNDGMPIDPFAEWDTILKPKSRLEPDDIRNACSQAQGRIQALLTRALAEAPVHAENEAMHPLVWGAARGLWQGTHYREAVAAAVGAVIDHVRQLTGRNDLDEKDVFAQAFSQSDPKVGEPRLRWPGTLTDQTVRSMNRGLLGFSTGVQAAIRNPSVHARTAMTPSEGTERLAAVSLLMRWVEQCVKDEAPVDQSAPPGS